MNKNDVQVTVVCITYNHEEFIAQALDSFLMQKTNFKYQIFVGEDCGPDHTADIVREYAEKYPDIVIPFIREKNMGAQRNLIDLCNHASSPYIAFCEGDDYWTDEYKLQKQFDFMENNPDVRVCFARAEIKAPDDWFLRSYFKEDKDGRLIFPDCDPLYHEKGTFLKSDSFITIFQAHTSTIFYRWNYDLEIPEWYYDGYIGDWPLFLMQLGNGIAGFLADIVSVYRRSDVGVYMSKNIDEHFLKSRREHVRLLTGMLHFYEEYYPKEYPKIMIENRIKHDTALFIQTALKLGCYDEILHLMEEHREGTELTFSAFLSFYFDSKRMTAKYSWEGNKAVARDRYFMFAFAPFIKSYVAMKRLYHKIKNILIKSCVYTAKLFGYWIYAAIPKNPTIWAFSGFYKKSYMDNTKYFYEYLLENAPDIRPVWFTKNKQVYEQLIEENKPVYLMNSLKGCFMMARAGIAVTDHFAMSDYSAIYGYNYRTKIVQLWHGVGFKALACDGKIVNSDVPGVRYSDDILAGPEDTFLTKLRKRIKFFFCAPVRELFERYYMLVCPGAERAVALGKTLHIPDTSYFYAGHPRNITLYQTKQEKHPYKILYAPTYRFREAKELEILTCLFEALPQIQSKMEQLDAVFILRLHPHTWRNYKPKISFLIKKYDRIFLDEEEDIYSSLGTYSVLITDYSSIALDFAMLGYPTVYFTPDYEWFIKNESGFTANYPNMIPGPQTFTWTDTLDSVAERLKNPEAYREYTKEKCSYFFYPDVNAADNSERICRELKQRLMIS